jgi:hypothetical protein
MPTGPSVAYWRNKAEESRPLAAAMTHAPSRETMLRIAADYERMAEFVERIEAADAGAAAKDPH